MNIARIPFFFWFLFSVTIFFYSCKENKEKKEITQIVSKWQDKEIIFPEDVVFTRYGQDTIPYEMPESDYKILCFM